MKKILLCSMLSLSIFACEKEQYMPTGVKITGWADSIYKGGGWDSLHLDPNMPNLCASTTSGTQSKLQITVLAEQTPTGRDAHKTWVYTPGSNSGFYDHGHGRKHTTCGKFEISIHEKTYDPSTGKFVVGSEIGSIDDDCMITLTINRKPRSIYIIARPNFRSQDIFSGPEVPVKQFEQELFQDCGA